MNTILDTLHIRKYFRRTHDPIWQLQLGVVFVIALQYFTDSSFLPYDKFLVIALEAVLMIALAIVTTDGYHDVSRPRRTLAVVLVGIIAAINIFSLIFLVRALLIGGTRLPGVELLANGFTIYTTNIFMFAMLYWEMDGGGPERRVRNEKQRDFLFPQMIHHYFGDEHWLPGFVDYLYLSTTNVTNFASADTVPLTHRSKLLMMIQAFVSVVAVVLVAAHAISILR
ncbi:MAG TPA: hypothetical protein VLG36_02295 [Candidatus Chromulinivoraceae bacterium]|nr:hypothetical protein [Candidatus Chromulinivoraceae bacterium]